MFEELEQLMKEIYSTKATISSGYRDSNCDRMVGGTGMGQHVNGKAVDISFYKADSTIVDTKYVSCIAQDLNYKGIARINDRSIHLDIRDYGIYYVDETKNNGTVTDDFYKYYNIPRKNDIREKVKNKYNFSEETMDYLCNYKYADALLERLL